MADNVIAEAFATIRPDVSGFKGELERGLASATSASDATTKSVTGLSRGLGDVKAEIGGLAQSALGTLSPALATTVGHFGSVTSSLSGAQLGLLGVAGGAVAAGVAIGDMALHGVKDFVSLADEVRNIKTVTGGTAEDASTLNAIFKATGVSAETGAAGVFKLSRNVSEHAGVLKADGIEIVRNKAGQVDLTGTLGNVADAYQKAGAGAAGNKVLFDAFGRSGLALAPIMRQNTEQLQEFAKAAETHHQILTDDDLAKARQYQVASHDLTEALSGLERELAVALIPTLTSVTKKTTGFIDSIDQLFATGHKEGESTFQRLNEDLNQFGSTVLRSLRDTQDLSTGTDAMAASFDHTSISADDYRHKLQDVTDDTDSQTQADADAKKAHDDYAKSLKESYDGLLDLRGAYRDEADAVASLSKTIDVGRQKDETAAQYKERLNTALDGTLRTLPAVIDGMVHQGVVTDSVSGRTNALVSMLQQLKGRYPELAGEIDTFIASAFNAAGQTYPLGVQTAQQYLKGVADGMVQGDSMVVGSADALAHHIENTIDFRLGITGGNVAPQPSQTGYGIGQAVGKGLSSGLNDAKKHVALTADQLGEMLAQHIRDSISGGLSAHSAVQERGNAQKQLTTAQQSLSDLEAEKADLPRNITEAVDQIARAKREAAALTLEGATKQVIDDKLAFADAETQTLVGLLTAQTTIEARIADAKQNVDDASTALITANQQVDAAGRQLVSLGPGAPGELASSLAGMNLPAGVVTEILNEVRYLIASLRPISVTSPDPASAGRAVALAIRTA